MVFEPFIEVFLDDFCCLFDGLVTLRMFISTWNYYVICTILLLQRTSTLHVEKFKTVGCQSLRYGKQYLFQFRPLAAAHQDLSLIHI